MLKNCFHIILARLLMKLSFFLPTTPADIESLMNCIKPNKTIDPNIIPTKLLKELKTEISEPLRDIIKVSFNKRIFPDFLKVANVIPIPKKGKKLDPNNYRHISLLSNISKLYETAMHI